MGCLPPINWCRISSIHRIITYAQFWSPAATFLPPEGPWPPVPFHIPLRPRRSTWGMMGITIRIGITNHEKCVFYHETHGDSSRNKQEQCWKTYWRMIVNFRNIWAAVCEGLMGFCKPHWSTRDGMQGTNPTHFGWMIFILFSGKGIIWLIC
jgi:hypothetical protein